MGLLPQGEPQAGALPQFWQVGAEAIGSDDPAVDAESIVLLSELLDRLGVDGSAAAARSAPPDPPRYREKLQEYLRANERELSEEVRDRIDLNPLRAFDSDHPGTREVMREGAAAPRRARHGEDRDHFGEVRALLDAAELSPTRSTRRSCAASTTTRARCSSSRRTRSARRAAWAAAGATTA